MTATDTTADALLANIRANHDDDAPRLQFADYLDECGQWERAEFIRVQCELARMPKRQRFNITASCWAFHRGEVSTLLEVGVTDEDYRRGNYRKVETGERIDVELVGHFPLGPNGGFLDKGKRRIFLGMLVTKVGRTYQRGGVAETPIELKMDAESGNPWPGEALRARERELLDNHGRQWLESSFPDWRHTLPMDLKWEWKRGFIGHVSGPLAALVGGDCQRCRQWLSTPGAAVGLCRDCHNIRRIPGILAAVLASPVAVITRGEQVGVSDKRPALRFIGLNGDQRWSWFGPLGDNSDEARLPGEIWHKLPRVDYATPDAATAALGRAVISLAGG